MIVTPVLRLFREIDREAAVGLFLELNHHEFAISGDRRTDRGGAESCVDDMVLDVERGAVAMVAEFGGGVVGLMVWAVKSDGDYTVEATRRYGFIQDIVVTEAHRGKGIAGAMLAEAERLTRVAGLSRLRLTVLVGNDSATSAYERSGFRDYSRGMIKDLA